MTYELQTKEYEGYVEVQLYGITGENTENIDEELILYRNNVKIYAQRVTTTIKANERILLYAFDDLYCGLGIPCTYSVKKIEHAEYTITFNSATPVEVSIASKNLIDIVNAPKYGNLRPWDSQAAWRYTSNDTGLTYYHTSSDEVKATWNRIGYQICPMEYVKNKKLKISFKRIASAGVKDADTKTLAILYAGDLELTDDYTYLSKAVENSLQLAALSYEADTESYSFTYSVKDNAEQRKMLYLQFYIGAGEPGAQLQPGSSVTYSDIQVEIGDDVSEYDPYVDVTQTTVDITGNSTIAQQLEVAADGSIVDMPVLPLNQDIRITSSNKQGVVINVTQQVANTQLIAMSEGAFLSSSTGTVLPVKFDLNIANYKYNIADSITPTLGGIYPFIRRNGNQRYRTFTLNGLISYHQEEYPKHGLYLAVSNEFKNSYSGAGALSESEADRIKEKLYRDAVIHFLQDNTIKLFRSLEEGSIFVHLSNINLTPKTELGRLIYSFSCTATECREYSDEALSKWLKEGEDTYGAI